ncbi:ankyrin repeat-containing protein [Anaeramoeba flamelloides]|uniref:Ankyrin repeat-containing protein n=1 Tax=Anaeramoeba flamelloides TaxID=1746091 RepID=A0AAV7YA56_9EUKA|nr:ankyrin repeat-containing protein [Anaeramoeba flamelloides]
MEISNSQLKSYLKTGTFKQIKEVVTPKNVNLIINEKKQTPLQVVCKREDLKLSIVKFLVKQGANINHRDFYGCTALYQVCELKKKKLKVISYLISKGADLNTQNEVTEPILLALLEKKRKPDPELIKLLLQNGASLSVFNAEGLTPLDLVCQQKEPNLEIIQLFIQNGSDLLLITNNLTALDRLMKPTSFDLIYLVLISYIKHLNVSPLLNLLFSEKNEQNLNQLKQMIKKKKLIDFQDPIFNASLIHWVCISEYCDMAFLSYILSNGNEEDEENENGIEKETLSELTFDDQSVLHWLLFHPKNRKIEMVHYFLKKGCPLNIVDQMGYNLLSFCILLPNYQDKEESNLEFLRCFHEQGENIDILDNHNNSLLHLICLNSNANINMIKYLVKNGVCFNSLNSKQLTPFLIYCKQPFIALPVINFFVNHNNKGTDKNNLNKSNNLTNTDKNLNTNTNINTNQNTNTNLTNTKFELNYITKKNYNCLHYLLKNENINKEILELILLNGIDVSVKGKNGLTALHLYCKMPHAKYEILKLLIDYKCQVDICGLRNITPLHTICSKRRIVFNNLKLLIQNDGNVLASNIDGETPLHYFLNNGQKPSLKVLTYLIKQIKKAKQKNAQNNFSNILSIACQNKTLTVGYYHELLKLDLNLNSGILDGKTALMLLCDNKKPDLNVVKLFIKKGAKIKLTDSKKRTAFHYLCKHHNKKTIDLELFKFFVGKFRNINIKDKKLHTPFMTLCMQPNLNITFLELLLQNGADIHAKSIRKQTVLHYACEIPNNLKVIKFLINNGADFYVQDNDGLSALHYIFSTKLIDFKLIKFLIGKKANFVVKDKQLQTPFYYLNPIIENLPILKLVYFKNYVNHQDNQNQTLLHKYCQTDNPSIGILKYLIMLNHKICPIDKMKYTPLMYYLKTKFPKIDILELFLQNGDNVTLRPSFILLILQNQNLSLQFIKFLLEKYNAGFKTQSYAPSILHEICESTTINIKILKILLYSGIDINKKNIQGNTPLHLYIQKHHRDENFLKIIYLFIKAGADYNIENRFYDKPIHLINSGTIYYQELKRMFASRSESLSLDFLEFLKSGDFCDENIKGIKVHKFVLEYRTNKTMEEIKKALKFVIDDDILNFIRWIYGSRDTNDGEQFQKICELLDINVKTFKSFEESIKLLYNSDETKDYEIIAKNEIIPVHKIILLCRSNLFRYMTLSTQSQSNKIHDYTKSSPEAIKIFIKYLYFDEIDHKIFSEKIIEELLECQNYYQLSPNSNFEFEVKYF